MKRAVLNAPVLLLVAVAVAVVLLLVAIVVGVAVAHDDRKPRQARPFDRSVWLTKTKARGSMLDDMLRQGVIKPCMSRSAAIRILGKPFYGDDRLLSYPVGRYGELADNGWFDVGLFHGFVIDVSLPLGYIDSRPVPGPYFKHWPGNATHPGACGGRLAAA